jgi:CRP-like cAMP-binding protein
VIAVDAETLATLRRVDFLAALDEAALGEFAARGRRQRYATGDRVFGQLEASSDVFVVLGGRAEVALEGRRGQRTVLGTLGPGSAFGEMSSITGQPRSATVTATEPLEVLCFADQDFDELRARRPLVPLALARVLAERLGALETRIDALLVGAPAAAPGPAPARASLRRAWNQLVVARSKDLGFIALAAFALTLVSIRLLVFASFRFDFAPRGVLRAAYMTGFALLIGSSWTSLATFRPSTRRWIAAAYGVGCALIANELGVTLAFDIFYRDIHTADPSTPFDIERLYRRTEAHRAVLLGLVVLVQAAYLRGFYRRAAFVLRTRLLRLFVRRRA